ncbi:MAG TPA: aminotransferase class I/II-fold pyridoxal phosphate-dependent enzyme [Ktedonobacterales bacterium]|nr:aminotransferase class I/II-fold pyridoxal phosphate-dependent enzyme [Ktedonobacterales bacterium]
MSIQQAPHQTTGAPLGLAPAARDVTPSATLAMNEAIAERRAAGHDVIHLAFGQASFPLPPTLRSALADAATHTGYAPVLGTPALRGAISPYLERTRRVSVPPGQIAVGPGSKPLLYALLQVLEGDLLLPVPSWVSYAPQARLAGRRVIGVQTDPDDHHRLTPQALDEAVARARREGADPRILLVNTPSNPTGGMFAHDDVEALAGWAREAGVTLICDEIYAELAHGWRGHVSPARFYPEGCIVTGGLSKAFSAGGWRLGYAAVPATEAGARVIHSLRALASEIWSAAATPIQDAALVAFSPSPEIDTYVRQSARLHGIVTGRLYDTLVALGVPCPRPAGAFYLYPDFAPWRAELAACGVRTSQELADYLLEEWDLATLPGSEFNEAPDALRLRLASSMLYGTDEARLWELLAAADQPGLPDDTHEADFDLPLLERAQTRLMDCVQYLGSAVNKRD